MRRKGAELRIPGDRSKAACVVGAVSDENIISVSIVSKK